MMRPLANKVLFAVSDLIKANRIIFDLPEHGGSYMQHRTNGSKVRIHQERGVFFIIVWYKVNPPKHLRTAREPATPMDVDAVDKPNKATADAPDPFVGRELTPP